MPSLEAYARSKLERLETQNLRRSLHETFREDGIWVFRGGRRLLSFSCNDYLNLTHNPKVKQAAIAAIERYGTGAGASRLVTGNHPLFSELEGRLARLKGTDAACLFGSGYLANAGIVPVLAGPGDMIVIDALAHSCLFAGAQLSRASVHVFRHNDMEDLHSVLERERKRFRHALVLTDRVFSMDGDLAPLDAIASLSREFDAWVMSDDAHGLGVLPPVSGEASRTGETGAIALQMGTLSKALGSYGGYLCASEAVIDLVKTRARTLVYSTGLPPASAAAAIAALDIIESDPDYCALPLEKAKRFTRAAGLADATSPIVPILLGDAGPALSAQAQLEDEDYLAVAIRPPTVPEGMARLRLAFTAGHPDGEIDRLADIVRTKVLGMKPR